jgi:uncharacterized protein YdeI (YjbR/CyaY-like superfamily)
LLWYDLFKKRGKSLDCKDNDILYDIKSREEFRKWLSLNSQKKTQCFVFVKMGKPIEQEECLFYLDAVEEAICFGWIDSVTKKDDEFGLMQRFSPRRKNSNWTELNKERARRMIKLGRMTKFGEKVLPNLGEKFKIDDELNRIFQDDVELLEKIKTLPELYFKIRVDNILKVKKDKEKFKFRLEKFIKETKKGKFYGQWNDFGRLN